MKTTVFVLAAAALLAAPCCAEESAQEIHQRLSALFAAGGDPEQFARETWPRVASSKWLWQQWRGIPCQNWEEFSQLLQSPQTEQVKLANTTRRLYFALRFGAAPAQPPVVDVAVPALPSCPLRAEHGELRGELDCLIVGSGPAGAVLAAELNRGGWKVAVVDQGALVVPGRTDTRNLPWLKEDAGASLSADGGIVIRTARATGGGSAVNIDLAMSPELPFVRRRLQQWHERGLYAFSPEEVSRAYPWVVSKLGTRAVPPSEINENNRVLWDGARALGLAPSLFQLNTYAPGQSPWNTTDKRSVVESLLLPAMQNAANPLTLLPEMRVERVRFQGRRAVGVELTALPAWSADISWHDPWQLHLSPGSRWTLSAPRVVLCAGSLGSAALLLRSGVDDLPVGRGVVLHPVVPVVARMNRPIQNLSGTPSSVYVAGHDCLFESASGEPAYVAQVLWDSPDKVAQTLEQYPCLAGFGAMLVDESRPDNHIALQADGTAVVHYSLSEADAGKLRNAVFCALRMFFAAGAQEVFLPTNEAACRLGSVEEAKKAVRTLQFLPGRTLLTSAHMQASCQVGRVVDLDGRVYGREGLYVLDSSIFPGSVGANPMQTIYTTAYLYARRWLTARAPSVHIPTGTRQFLSHRRERSGS